MTAWHGFLTFSFDTPIIGLDPHPAWAPQEIATLPQTSEGWVEVYGGSASEADLLIAAEQDAQDFDTDEADIVFPVTIHPDGTLDIYDGTNPDIMRSYSAKQVFAAFGMTLPEIP